MDLGCGVFLLSYFLLFAYATYARTVQVLASRREPREQKLFAEIEHKRAESLLLSLLPSPMATEFRESGAVLPRQYAEVTMLAIDFLNLPELAATAGGNGWLMDLNYCLQALDGIAKRRAMEVVSSGDTYVAVTGVVGPSRLSRAEALAAAMEMRDVAYRLAAQRRAEDRPYLMVRIAVHSGPWLRAWPRPGGLPSGFGASRKRMPLRWRSSWTRGRSQFQKGYGRARLATAGCRTR